MSQHYSEVDLLETYYLQPGASMPVMMHLADCEECAARYERLEQKLRSSAACDRERADTFWSRQRQAILRRVDGERVWRTRRGSLTRVAAAAVLALTVGGLLTLRQTAVSHEGAGPAQTAATNGTAATIPAAEATTGVSSVSSDPWQSDQLKDFQTMVAWESWVDTTTTATKGNHPL